MPLLPRAFTNGQNLFLSWRYSKERHYALPIVNVFKAALGALRGVCLKVTQGVAQSREAIFIETDVSIVRQTNPQTDKLVD